MPELGARSAPPHWGAIHVVCVADRRRPCREVVHIGHTVRWTESTSAFHVVPAGVPHAGASGPPPTWAVGFCERCVALDDSLLAPIRRVRVGASPATTAARNRGAWITQLFAQLDEECRQPSSRSELIRGALLALILGELRRTMGAPVHSSPGTAVARALEFVWDNALEPISLKDVAAHVALSPKHVAGLVKDATGHSVGAWIRSTRLEAAAAWLLHGDDSVAQIAERVGWSDPSHFIRHFREAHGETPGAWRRRFRGIEEPSR